VGLGHKLDKLKAAKRGRKPKPAIGMILALASTSVLAFGCAGTQQVVIDLSKEAIGTPEKGRELLTEACSVAEYQWGCLEGLGLLKKITKEVDEMAEEFWSYCKRLDAQGDQVLTNREVGKGNMLYLRIAGSLAKGLGKDLAVKLAPLVGGVAGIPNLGALAGI
jgi:hypothetical protein